jgi:hypothetical protein
MLLSLAACAIVAAADIRADKPPSEPGRDRVPQAEDEFWDCMDYEGFDSESDTAHSYVALGKCGLLHLPSEFSDLLDLCPLYFGSRTETALESVCAGSCQVIRQPYCESDFVPVRALDDETGRSVPQQSLLPAFIVETVLIIGAAGVALYLMATNRCDCFVRNEDEEPFEEQ